MDANAIDRTCKVVNCQKPVGYGRGGFCRMHAARMERTGRLDKKTTFERLLARIEKQADGCWNYTRYRDRSGYGRLRFKGKKVLAHRASYEFHFGPFDSSLLVCHHCDNPACVNPKHLFLGTNRDNMQDAIAKGRFPKPQFGADNHNTKLSETDVAIIVSELKSKSTTVRELAERFNVTMSSIRSRFKKSVTAPV